MSRLLIALFVDLALVEGGRPACVEGDRLPSSGPLPLDFVDTRSLNSCAGMGASVFWASARSGRFSEDLRESVRESVLEVADPPCRAAHARCEGCEAVDVVDPWEGRLPSRRASFARE